MENETAPGELEASQQEGVQNREAYLNETIELNDIESFCFFLKISSSIKRLAVLDSLVMKRKKAVAYVSSDHSEHNRFFRAGLRNASTGDLLEKLKFEKRKLYKGYRHHHLSNKIATVWFVDSLITMSAVTVSEAELSALLHDRPADIVSVQPLLGGVPLSATGTFEHRYKIGPTGRESFETFELMNDIRSDEGKVNYDDLNFYNTGVNKLQVAGHKINMLLEREMRRILDFLELSLNIRVSNLCLQVVFDSTLRAHITAAKDMVIIGCPSEYYYHREHIYYIEGEAPSLPVSNDTVSELLLSLGRVVSAPKHTKKPQHLFNVAEEGATGAGSSRGADDEQGQALLRDTLGRSSSVSPLPLHSPDKKRNIRTRVSPFRALSPTRDVSLGRTASSGLKMNVSKSCSNFELNTLSQYVKQSSYLASMLPLEVPWGPEQHQHTRPHSTGWRQEQQGIQEVKLPGIYKSMLMPTKDHNCRGVYCHLSRITPADEARGSKNKLFVAPIKSVLMAKAEEQFLEDSALSRVNFGNATRIYNDQNLNYFARLQLERVEQKVLDRLKTIGLTSIPRFNYSLLDYYDQFSRRAIYTDLLSSIHVSRLYHTVPVCATCQKMYSYFDGLRDQIVFHGRVHKDPVRRPLKADVRRPASSAAGGAVAASPGDARTTVREIIAGRRPQTTASPEEENEEEEEEEGDYFPSADINFQHDYGDTFLLSDSGEEAPPRRQIAARHAKARVRSKAQPLTQGGARTGEQASVRQRASKTLSAWLNMYRKKADREGKERLLRRSRQSKTGKQPKEEKEEEEDDEEEEEEEEEGEEEALKGADGASRRSSNEKSLSAFAEHKRRAKAEERQEKDLHASATKIESRISDFRKIYASPRRHIAGGLGARRGSVMPAR